MAIIWKKSIIKRLILITLSFILCIVIFRLYFTKNSGAFKKFAKKASLSYKKQKFYLLDEPFQIFSGSIHYFRVPSEMWKNRLQYLKSAGLNTVTTYSPWNLHEERRGYYNFEGNLNLRKFVQIAQELGLYVILRPGPYICSEFEFGGMPSWLLADPNMKVRSMYIGFLNPATEYIKQLMREVNDLQHSNGGPIIAFQIENEYGTFGSSKSYILALKNIFQKAGVVESMFVSNNADGYLNQQRIDDVFMGINSNSIESIEKVANMIKSIDSDNPVFISEFWTGWFHMWGVQGNSNVISDDDFKMMLKSFLKRGYNFNLYMFHGGTNFGFTNGAGLSNDRLNYVVTSYDYSAPISEDGRPTNKYYIVRKTLLLHLSGNKNFKMDDVPENEKPVNYGEVEMTHSMELSSILDHIDDSRLNVAPLSMEELKINGNTGQNFGFILYQADVANFTKLKIEGRIRDRAVIMASGEAITGNWRTSFVKYNIEPVSLIYKSSNYTNNKVKNVKLEILVENMGRANYASFQSDLYAEQRKGLFGKVYIDKSQINNWKIYPMEFQKSFMNKISSSSSWKKVSDQKLTNPRLYKGVFTLTEKPSNTYISMTTWTKGVVFVNGFNLGRYWNIGPVQTLFLPKSFLRYGENEIIIFELHLANKNVRLQSNPVFLLNLSPYFT